MFQHVQVRHFVKQSSQGIDFPRHTVKELCKIRKYQRGLISSLHQGLTLMRDTPAHRHMGQGFGFSERNKRRLGRYMGERG
ncbi:hypothetical protein FKM82_027233 [Ascaphus truei]